MKHSSFYILGVLIILTLAIGGCVAFGFTMMGEMRSEVSGLKQEIKNQDEQIKRMNALRASFDLVKEDQETLDRYFFSNTEEDWLRFVTSIESLGQIAGVRAVTTATDFAINRPFSVSVTFTGDKQGIDKYLSLIDSYPAKITTTRFLLQQNQDGSWNGELTLDLVSIRKK